MPAESSTLTDLLDREDLRLRVNTAITTHLDRLHEELRHIGSEATDMEEALRRLTHGGKRLRAALCYWSARAHGHPLPADDVVGVCVALELFQAAALIHDDIIDDADTRRGSATAHVFFATGHRNADHHGDPDRFGTAAAILAGDLVQITAQREFDVAARTLAAERADRARDLFSRMQVEVMAGQYLDVLGQALPLGTDLPRDEARARAVIRAKSARYSVEYPLVLGAVFAGADPGSIARLAKLGTGLGEAFQLRDDVLGVFGDPDVTGKPAGDDIREGKRTVLVIKALSRTRGDDLDFLRGQIGRADIDDRALQRVRSILRDSGALEETEREIARLRDLALDGLAAADLHEPARGTLLGLAEATVTRVA